MTKPFVKWVGGKQRLVRRLLDHVPVSYGCFYEPFLGGGALFFALAPERAVLADSNQELVTTYRAVRDATGQVLAALKVHDVRFGDGVSEESKAYYYEVRAMRPTVSWEIAARLIFLNKTGFNGLYRVNAKGEFNVPFGKWARRPTICDEATLTAAAAALAGRFISRGDYAGLMITTRPGDFVYMDPPYAEPEDAPGHTAYTADKFGVEQQQRLARWVRRLAKRGVHVLLSNADVPLVRELYAGMPMTELSRQGTVSSKKTKRGRVAELLIRTSDWNCAAKKHAESCDGIPKHQVSVFNEGNAERIVCDCEAAQNDEDRRAWRAARAEPSK